MTIAIESDTLTMVDGSPKNMKKEERKGSYNPKKMFQKRNKDGNRCGMKMPVWHAARLFASGRSTRRPFKT